MMLELGHFEETQGLIDKVDTMAKHYQMIAL